MTFAANIAVDQEVIVAAIMVAFLYLHASDVHQHSFNRSRVATLLLRSYLPKLVYKTCAHISPGSYPILDRLVDVCS